MKKLIIALFVVAVLAMILGCANPMETRDYTKIPMGVIGSGCIEGEGIDCTVEGAVYRASGMVPNIPAVGDQSSLGSCVAWGNTCAVSQWFDIDRIAPNWVMMHGSTYASNMCNGSWCDDGLQFLDGLSYYYEDACPRYSTKCQCTHSGCSTYSKSTFSYSGINNRSSSIIPVLASGKAVAFCSTIYYNFYYSSSSYIYCGGGSVLGGHAMCICGYDDNKGPCPYGHTGAYRVQNSWGTGWGDSGYLWYCYVEMDQVGECYKKN